MSSKSSSVTSRACSSATRRGVLPLVLVAILAACGDAAPAASAGSGSEPSPTPTAGAVGSTGLPESWEVALEELRCTDTSVGDFPRTVQHDGGETTIDAPPQRVVSIEGTTSLDMLLLMGVTPAASGGDVDGPAIYDYQAHLAGGTPSEPGFTVLQKRPEVDIEAIAAARPDLIISQTGWLEGIEAQLQDLGVPIISFAWDGSGNPPDWRNNVRIVGESVGRDACVTEIIDDVETAISSTRLVLEDAGVATDTFTAAIAIDGYTAYYGADDPIGIMLAEELGLDLQPDDGAQTEFSLETAQDVLVGDHVLFTDFYDDGATDAFLADPVVGDVTDRAVVLDEQESGVAYYPSALGQRLFLEVLNERFGAPIGEG